MNEQAPNGQEIPEDQKSFKRTINSAIAYLAQEDIGDKERTFIVLAIGNKLFPQSILTVSQHLGKDENQTRRCSDLVEKTPTFREIRDATMKHIEEECSQPEKTSQEAKVAKKVPAPRQLQTPRQQEETFEAPQVDIVYEHRWEGQAKRNPGLSTERFKIIIAEHVTRYPGIPLNCTKVGEAMGQYSRQRAWQILTDLNARGELPEGLLLQKTKTKSQKRGN